MGFPLGTILDILISSDAAILRVIADLIDSRVLAVR